MAKRAADGVTYTSEESEVGGLDELHASTSKELMSAYIEENSVYSGSYLTKVRNIYDEVKADDAEFDAGRRVVNLAVSYFDKGDPSIKCGTGFIKTSPELRRTERGQIDQAASRYAELARALRLSGEDPEEVYEQATTQMFLTKVAEKYVVPGNDLHDSHSDAKVDPRTGDAWVTLEREDVDEREYYQSLGLEPKIMVGRISRVK